MLGPIRTKGVPVKSALAILVAVAALAGPAFALTHRSGAAATSQTPVNPPQNVMYGHIRTMTAKGGHFEMKLDPAWWLTGVTAERAKLEDTGSREVPNDYYIVEEGHRLLTFVVFRTARVTVLTGGTNRTRISAAELAQIVSGKNPRHRRLSEPQAGFWIRIGQKYPSPAVTVDQQYQP
jgi:hypothetical protein